MKRIIAFILICIMIAGALSGCGYASSAEEREPVFSLLGFDVPYEVYRFYVMTAKVEHGLLDEEGNTVTTDAELLAKAEKTAMDSICNLYAALYVAEQYGMHVDDEFVVKEAERYFDSLKATYESESDFREDMQAAYMNKSVVMLVYSAEYLQNEAYARALEDGSIDRSKEALRAFFASDELIRVKHILLQPSVFTNAKDMANTAHAKALAAESFDEVFDLYKKSGIYTEERYVARGETLESFEDAAFALAVGELSPVVQTSAGYSILMRYEKDPAILEEEWESFEEKYCVYCFNRFLEEAKEAIDIQYYDAYSSYSFAEIGG